MKQKITIKVDSTFKYLQLWNGIFNLTDMELKVLAALIDSSKVLEESNICSIKTKKSASRSLGIKDYNTLNNYVKKFKDKKAIHKHSTTYKLNQLLNTDTRSVQINIQWGI